MRIQRVVLKLMLSLVAILASNISAYSSPIVWSGNDHAYDLVDVQPGGITWTASKGAAESSIYLGVPGHLVTITSAAENLWLTTTFTPAQLDGRWIGAYQFSKLHEPAGDWAWVTGEPWAYTNWFPGEPNNPVEARTTVSSPTPRPRTAKAGTTSTIRLSAAMLWIQGTRCPNPPR